jgi:hypothetical protein
MCKVLREDRVVAMYSMGRAKARVDALRLRHIFRSAAEIAAAAGMIPPGVRTPENALMYILST